jgi:hypothetical protein
MARFPDARTSFLYRLVIKKITDNSRRPDAAGLGNIVGPNPALEGHRSAGFQLNCCAVKTIQGRPDAGKQEVVRRA